MFRLIFLKAYLGHCVQNKLKGSKDRNKMRQGNCAIIQAREDGGLSKSSDSGFSETS